MCIAETEDAVSNVTGLNRSVRVQVFRIVWVCINPQPISPLGPSALGLIFVSRVDTACDTDLAMNYSLSI